MSDAIFKLYAEIPESFRQDGIRWAVLEHDPDDTGGCFIYLHESLDDEAVYDEWYEDRSLAQLSAMENWGIKPENWKAF
jgi:hypothetical protein